MNDVCNSQSNKHQHISYALINSYPCINHKNQTPLVFNICIRELKNNKTTRILLYFIKRRAQLWNTLLFIYYNFKHFFKKKKKFEHRKQTHESTTCPSWKNIITEPNNHLTIWPQYESATYPIWLYEQLSWLTEHN